MESTIKQHICNVELFTTSNEQELESFRIKYLGKHGILNILFETFKSTPPDLKKVVGNLLNQLRNSVNDRYESLKNTLNDNYSIISGNTDLFLSTDLGFFGSRHPLSLIKNEIIQIFSHIGFTIAEGPEIEDDLHIFTGLNFQPDHPARDMQDTFFIEQQPELLLRTHTSSVQIRLMKTHPPPIRVLMPGRVYRNEAISSRAHCFFHQIEGLYIDKNVSFSDLKQSLLYFSKEMFSADTIIRLRPSYFPFTEPSAEMDISCTICKGSGCNMCKNTGWVEILGCGMVDPNVLEYCGIDSTDFTGFAFGMGIERIANLKYSIKDLRFFSENDIRFLRQFKTVL
ncbi:MAG: phenylalanine--tRNA ligase subunit alpha [Bacteroidota bacterium]